MFKPRNDKLYFVPLKEIERLRYRVLDRFSLAKILSSVLRINTLYMIKKAGSGHIGTSFSSIDIMLWLWICEMHKPNEFGEPDSDIFFSSKGHDVPALYSVLTALGKLPFGQIHQLRRLGGLPGHPDIHTPYIATNTGPLGMGISKARGMAIANRLNGSKGRIFVITGDGELQEGQIWESLQPAVNGNFSELHVIADLNQIQSNMEVSKTSNLGEIESKFKAFGWKVAGCDGNNFEELELVFNNFKKVPDKPKILLARTIKGKGVSFMERLDENGFYQFHSGAPSDENYYRALEELVSKMNGQLEQIGEPPLLLKEFNRQATVALPPQAENLIRAYGEELLTMGREEKNLVVLDADLTVDCGLLPFKKEFPERFIECGIAEQDMVSVAGGLALRKKLPVVNSFACFLSTRPNEQIYTNASEQTKIIYVGHLAGILPAAPGHSHQSVRDISALGSVPGLTIIQPCNEAETKMALRWAVCENTASTYIRLVTIPTALDFKLPPKYALKKGCGVRIRTAKKNRNEVAIVAYGPTILQEAFRAADVLEQEMVATAVFNFPWLNCVDPKWAFELISFDLVVFVEDHYSALGLGSTLIPVIADEAFTFNMENPCPKFPKFLTIGLQEIPACGQDEEVLRYHRLDANSIAIRIKHLTTY